MRLQSKISLIVAAVFIASGLAVLGVFDHVILKKFEHLENVRVHHNISRVEAAFLQEIKSLQQRGVDWGMWDDSYAFVQGRAPDFIETNFTYEGLEPLNFSHIAFFGLDTSLVHGVQLDKKAGEIKPFSPELLKKLVDSGVLRRALDSKEWGGFLSTSDQMYLVIACSIRDSAGQAEPAGVLLIMREMSRSLVEQIARMTKVNIKATLIDSASTDSKDRQFIEAERAFIHSIADKNHDLVLASSQIRDIFGEAFVNLSMAFPRDIYHEGLGARSFFSLMLGLVGLVSGLVVIALVRYLVLRPVSQLVSKLYEITLTSEFGERVPALGSDEIGTLGAQINSTLAALQTALLRAEESQHLAESANRAKSSFIAKVSHELRTPIHSITGMLRILLKEERSGAKRNYIMMAKNAAYGLLETINEILDFSKVEAGKLILEKIEFSLHEVIRDSMQTVGPRVEEKGSLETIVDVSQGIPNKLIGDPLRLKQVLVNLLGNAAKFTKAGHIGLKVDVLGCESGRALLEMVVFDTGVGIPEDRIEHIFEPFSQADESVSRMFTGTGLGLTIVKQFIEGMGGAVSVESEVGSGSKFILRIPFDLSDSAEPLVFMPKLLFRKVAIVDGDSIVAKCFAVNLESNGLGSEIFDSDRADDLNNLFKSIDRYGLMIVTSEALKRSRVFDLVVEMRGRDSIPVVCVLSPFEISVRERLLALEVPFVVTRPISLVDILGVVSGEIELKNDGWEDSEESSLQSERALEVLIADDAQTNRIILSELLRDAGHNVVCVENGVDLVSKVRDSIAGVEGAPKFDLILTDVQMPLLDGLNATAQIRALEKNGGIIKHLPIVAVTAHAMTDETSRMRQFGVDDVVTKPLDPIRLGQVIQKLTGSEAAASLGTSKSGLGTTMAAGELSELVCRLWAQLARRDRDLSALFLLSDEPQNPEDLKKVLDISDVLERTGNSVRRTLLIFSGFLECFRDQIIKLSEAKQASNFEDLRFAAHALKGLLLDVGAKVAGDVASTVEQSCMSGQQAEALSLVGQLTKQVLAVSRLVTQICQVATGGLDSQEALNAVQSRDQQSPFN